MFLRIQILAKFSTFMLTAFCYKEAENMKWGEGNKQIQAAKCDPFAAWNLEATNMKGDELQGQPRKNRGIRCDPFPTQEKKWMHLGPE